MIVTPLQNANMMATIANRGYYISPHVFKYADGEDSLLQASQKHYTKVQMSSILM